MPEQTQIDSEFQDSEIERRLARLENLINAYEQGGFDIFRQFGYLQLGIEKPRLDHNGIMVANQNGTANGGLGKVGFWILPRLVPTPGEFTDSSALFPRSALLGYAIESSDLTSMTMESDALYNDVYARVQTLAGPTGSFVTLETGNAANEIAQLQISNPDGGPSTLNWSANGTTIALGGGGMSLIVKEADETVNNSTTLQDDNELLFAVAANEVVQFEGVLMISTDPNADFKLTFTGPAGAVGSFAAIYGDVTTGNADASSAALGSAATLISVNDGSVVRFWGGIHNGGTAGNLTLQWAQNTANVSDSKVLAGSYLKWQAET